MTDTLTPEQRSERMSRIRGRDTMPEIKVRRLIHSLGYRFRLGRRDLPGKPDIVLPRHKAIVFVHGCFWHRHPDPSCRIARLPKSRIEFWEPKLNANQARDGKVLAELESLGWKVLVIWECELKDEVALRERVAGFLGGSGGQSASD